MTPFRTILGPLIAALTVGGALAYLAGWFDPCIGMSRFDACSITGGDDLPPCSLEVCDHRPGAGERLVSIGVGVALLAFAGFIAAAISRRAYFVIAAAGAALAMLVGRIASGYLFPYPRPAVYADPGTLAVLFECAVAGLPGLVGGWLARRLTNRPTITPD